MTNASVLTAAFGDIIRSAMSGNRMPTARPTLGESTGMITVTPSSAIASILILFQVIQGAHYEPWRGRKSSQYAYQRIDTIADHLHFVGLGNVRNGLGSDAEDAAGGGHAHCGTMIYLGDSFPASYRNQLFTNNIHGRRINNDLLRRKGSGYVASHGPDLMRSQDPWFMGVTLAYGPAVKSMSAIGPTPANVTVREILANTPVAFIASPICRPRPSPVNTSPR